MVTSPAPVRPQALVLRCYGRRAGRERSRWIAHCIDLDVWAVGGSIDEVRESLESAISGYLETVFDTEDQASIPRLLLRCAPLRYVLLGHVIRLANLLDGKWNTSLDSCFWERSCSAAKQT